MALKNVYYKILMIWINNDSLFFSRSNIVDYSLLVIIDKAKKTVRFGIIDYIQQYDGKKMIESKFKAIIAAGDIPTIGTF
jgi:1-phosphatidylinositol-3-phosphate 5-kinase